MWRMRRACLVLDTREKCVANKMDLSRKSLASAWAWILGGGREKQDDAIDPAVGIVLEKKIGSAVKSGDALCTVHYNADARLQEAMAMLEDSFVIRAQPPPSRTPLIRKIVGA